MKRKNCITTLMAVLIALPMLMAVGGCFWDHHEDRDDHDRNAERHDQGDKDHHDDHHDADVHVDVH